MALGRMLAATTALALIAACGTVESAGRNSREGAAPPPPVTQSAPPPTQQAAPPPSSAAAPGVSVAQPAPGVSVAQPAPAPRQTEQPRSSGGGDNIVVPGQVGRQVPVPQGDPRSASERMADIRAWDRCVMQVQGQASSDPLRPALDAPEDVCRNELGMADRDAVPVSRR